MRIFQYKILKAESLRLARRLDPFRSPADTQSHTANIELKSLSGGLSKCWQANKMPAWGAIIVAVSLVLGCSKADPDEPAAVAVNGKVLGLGYSGEGKWGNLEVGALSLTTGNALGLATTSTTGDFSLEIKVKPREVVLFSVLPADPASHLPLFSIVELQ